MGRGVMQMAIYRKDESFYSRADFTRSIAEKIFSGKGAACLRISDAYHLFCYAKKIPDGGTYFEIGSFLGGSLRCAYEGIRTAGTSVKLIGIEPGGIGLKENTKLIPNLHLIRDHSDNAVCLIRDSSVNLLFLDSDHRYEQTRKDILNYWPKIKLGGILLAHDYFTARGFEGFSKAITGVKQAIDEKFSVQNLTTFPRNSLLCAIQKKHENLS
ncbi:hypothetical protein ES703_89815 [subsurface metagenome]